MSPPQHAAFPRTFPVRTRGCLRLPFPRMQPQLGALLEHSKRTQRELPYRERSSPKLSHGIPCPLKHEPSFLRPPGAARGAVRTGATPPPGGACRNEDDTHRTSPGRGGKFERKKKNTDPAPSPLAALSPPTKLPSRHPTAYRDTRVPSGLTGRAVQGRGAGRGGRGRRLLGGGGGGQHEVAVGLRQAALAYGVEAGQQLGLPALDGLPAHAASVQQVERGRLPAAFSRALAALGLVLPAQRRRPRPIYRARPPPGRRRRRRYRSRRFFHCPVPAAGAPKRGGAAPLSAAVRPPSRADARPRAARAVCVPAPGGGCPAAPHGQRPPAPRPAQHAPPRPAPLPLRDTPLPGHAPWLRAARAFPASPRTNQPPPSHGPRPHSAPAPAATPLIGPAALGPSPNGSHPGARSLLPRRSPQCTVLTTQKKPCTPPAHVHFLKDFQLLQLTSPQLLTKWLSAHRAGGWARGASVLSERFLWSSFNHVRCVDACGSFGLCSVWPTASVPLFTGTSPN